MTGDYLSAVILAGGQSRRMGKDKALLPIAYSDADRYQLLRPKVVSAENGTTLLQHTCAVARSCTDRVFVLSSIPYDLPLGCQWIAEDPPHQGPLKAFAGCLEQIESEWILLLACDLPYLDDRVLRRWIGELEQVTTDSIAYLAPHPKGWECLCGFYRWQCCWSLPDFILAGGSSFQSWLSNQKVQAILEAEPNMLINLNSPSDFSA